MPWFIKSKAENRKSPKDEIWVRCERCRAHIYRQDWENAFRVCPACNYHAHLTAQERINLVIDGNTFEEFDHDITPADPLSFVDAKGSYAEKVSQMRQSTRLNESVVTGSGTINGIEVVVAVMDFRFLGGSLGSGTGEKILLAANRAAERRLPFIVFSASGGARMHEGILSLMQMAKTCAAIARLDDKRLPYISVLTDPTTGGVSASFAMVGDINIAEPGALIGFAGRRVIEQTIKHHLPDDFQTAEYLLAHGFIDAIVNRKDLKQTLGTILSYSTASLKKHISYAGRG